MSEPIYRLNPIRKPTMWIPEIEPGVSYVVVRGGEMRQVEFETACKTKQEIKMKRPKTLLMVL